MSLSIEARPVDQDVLSRLRPEADEVWLVWLGQAGFLIARGRHRILIDPYLSDFLAQSIAAPIFPIGG